MRLALFSDIHGNPYACRALLGNRRIAPFPHIANPFQLTPAETRQMDRVLRLTGLLQ